MTGASSDHASRTSLIESLRSESHGDLYVAFTIALHQLIEGKMEASVYEDVLRTLLGTNAYILFTLVSSSQTRTNAYILFTLARSSDTPT